MDGWGFFCRGPMNITTLPMLSIQLVEELDKLHPPRCIGPNETLREADRYAGKRELIEFLLSLRDTQGTTKR